MKKVFLYVCLAAAMVAIAFFIGRCSSGALRKQQTGNLIAARDSVAHSVVEINSLQNYVATKNALILTQADAIKAGIVEREKLKALHLKELVTNADLTGIIKILRDSLKLPPEIQFVTIKDTSGSYLAVRVPYQWKYTDKFVSLTTGIRLNKLGYFDLAVPFSGTMSIGYVRSGFLKTKPVGLFTSENPYLVINNMDILIVQDKKNLFQRTWFHMLMGGAIVETANILLRK